MRTFLVCLFVLAVALFSQAASSATFGALSATPIAEADHKHIGQVSPEGRIYAGDIIYYADTLIKSGIVANRWPSGRLYYQLDPTLTASQKDAFLKACEGWSATTPVVCVERSTEPNFVRVANHNGEHCSGAYISCSALGMRGGQQDLFIYDGHWAILHVIQHELGHAFGLIHEQQRQDRDAYVTILWHNVKAGAASQFNMIPVATATEYDFESIMHYNNCAFSTQPCDQSAPTEASSTIFPKACSRDLVGGIAITSLDADGMREAYLPRLYGLFVLSRRSACGVHNLSPQQVALVCGASNCSQASPVSYNKVEPFHHEECTGGFVTSPPAFRQCPALKTLTSSSHNSATFSCGFMHLHTRYYWDWSCGCAKQTVEKLCTDVDANFDAAFLNKLRQSPDPQDKATVRYIDQVAGWRKLGYVEDATAKSISMLLIKNYAQNAFAESLYLMLCNMRINIELNLYVKKSYTLRHTDFLRLASAAGITI